MLLFVSLFSPLSVCSLNLPKRQRTRRRRLFLHHRSPVVWRIIKAFHLAYELFHLSNCLLCDGARAFAPVLDVFHVPMLLTSRLVIVISVGCQSKQSFKFIIILMSN